MHAEPEDASVFEQAVLEPMDPLVGDVVISKIQSFQVFDGHQRFGQRSHPLIRDLIVPQYKRSQPLVQGVL